MDGAKPTITTPSSEPRPRARTRRALKNPDNQDPKFQSKKTEDASVDNAIPQKPTPAESTNPTPKRPSRPATVANTTKNQLKEGFPPPPPAGGPPEVVPPPPAANTQAKILGATKPVASSGGNDRGDLLRQIQQGIKLKKVQESLNHPNQKPVKKDEKAVSITYKTGREYLEEGLIDYYEEALMQLVIDCEGVPKEDTPPGLVRLMKGHARETGKDKLLAPTKASDNFNEDIVKAKLKAKEKGEYKVLDRKALLQADAAENSRSTTVSAYQQYVRGRDRKRDTRNDFTETFHRYVSKKLVAYETAGKLKATMLKDYGIQQSVRSPNVFFDDHPELKAILDELGVPVSWLDTSDMTDKLLDALVHFRKTGEKEGLKKPIGAAIERQLANIQKQQESLKASEENLKKLSNGLN